MKCAYPGCTHLGWRGMFQCFYCHGWYCETHAAIHFKDDSAGQERHFWEQQAQTVFGDLAESMESERLLRRVLKRCHDALDDTNAAAGVDGAMCIWCDEKGYDGDGLKHKETCVLVAARKLL